jgi:hypothetical protein
MFGLAANIQSHLTKVSKAAKKGVYKSIGNAAFSIRKAAVNLIQKSDSPSTPGQPVSTRGKRGNAKRSIFVAADEDAAIIGPRYSFVGDAMEAHEFGKSRFGQDYPARPTMAPALEKNIHRFPEEFSGSIGE